MSVPQRFVPLISAWLAREGYTILTAPQSLVTQAMRALGLDRAA